MSEQSSRVVENDLKELDIYVGIGSPAPSDPAPRLGSDKLSSINSPNIHRMNHTPEEGAIDFIKPGQASTILLATRPSTSLVNTVVRTYKDDPSTPAASKPLPNASLIPEATKIRSDKKAQNRRRRCKSESENPTKIFRREVENHSVGFQDYHADWSPFPGRILPVVSPKKDAKLRQLLPDTTSFQHRTSLDILSMNGVSNLHADYHGMFNGMPLGEPVADTVADSVNIKSGRQISRDISRKPDVRNDANVSNKSDVSNDADVSNKSDVSDDSDSNHTSRSNVSVDSNSNCSNAPDDCDSNSNRSNASDDSDSNRSNAYNPDVDSDRDSDNLSENRLGSNAEIGSEDSDNRLGSNAEFDSNKSISAPEPSGEAGLIDKGWSTLSTTRVLRVLSKDDDVTSGFEEEEDDEEHQEDKNQVDEGANEDNHVEKDQDGEDREGDHNQEQQDNVEDDSDGSAISPVSMFPDSGSIQKNANRNVANIQTERSKNIQIDGVIHPNAQKD